MIKDLHDLSNDELKVLTFNSPLTKIETSVEVISDLISLKMMLADLARKSRKEIEAISLDLEIQALVKERQNCYNSILNEPIFKKTLSLYSEQVKAIRSTIQSEL